MSQAPKRAYAAVYGLLFFGLAFSFTRVFHRDDGEGILVLHNARLSTPDGRLPQTGLVIRDTRIAALISERQVEAWRQRGARVEDLGGAVVIPGLRDAHTHLHNLGEKVNNFQARAKSREDLFRKIRERLATGEKTWLWGRGWDESTWQGDQRIPDSTAPLDAVTGPVPVFLKRVDGHTAWVNKAALDIAGITDDTPDPPGGKIVRNAAGHANGILIDRAKLLVEEHIPPGLRGGVEQNLRLGLKLAAEAGLVGVHEAGMPRAELEALLKIAGEGPLPVRVYVMISSKDQRFFAEQMARGPRIGLFDDHVTIRAIKITQDGAMGQYGAALLEGYTDMPRARGVLVTAPEQALALTRAAARAGFQVCTHAIGDRANRIVLDHFAEAFSNDDDDQRLREARFRVEHAQVLHPADLDRFAELGVIASMQPTHQTTDMRWVANRLGADRLTGAYAWRSLLDSGARLAFGSDVPVEPVDPRRGLYSAITRRDPKTFQPEGGWRAQEALTGGEALAGFTEWAAFAAFEEEERGQLKVGHKADLTILSDDPVELAETAPEKIMALKVLGTYVNGRAAVRPTE